MQPPQVCMYYPTSHHNNVSSHHRRWAKFAGVSVPWLTSLANAFLSGQLEQRQGELARAAVDNLEKLGPTFLKLAQILSIRCAAASDWGTAAAGSQRIAAAERQRSFLWRQPPTPPARCSRCVPLPSMRTHVWRPQPFPGPMCCRPL